LAAELQAGGRRVALAYADCGSYGALDQVCADLGIERLAGLHCYDVLGGADRIAAMLESEPGTYLLTDFLVRSFRRTVLAELGLDRHPQLWPDYFGHYRRVVWLAQHPDPALTAEAERVAAMFGLPLTIVETGTARLERELARLVGPASASPAAAGESVAGETVAREAMARETMATEAMARETMATEAMTGETMATEAMTGETMAT